MELPMFQFAPIAHCAVAGQYQKEYGPIPLTPIL